MSERLAPRAHVILHDWIQSESLRKHCYAVADSMKHFAQLRGEDADLWEAVGLLHDMDYERHPIAVVGVGDPGGKSDQFRESRGQRPGPPKATRLSASPGSARTVGARKCAARFFRTPITQASRGKRLSRKLYTPWMS